MELEKLNLFIDSIKLFIINNSISSFIIFTILLFIIYVFIKPKNEEINPSELNPFEWELFKRK
jgi:hypothetical protein